MIVQIPAGHSGQGLTLTIKNDQNSVSTSADDDGGLFVPGGDFSTASATLSVAAADTPSGPMAFAIYRAPKNFSRGSADDGLAQRNVTLEAVDDGGHTTVRT
jgi:hypothetical protein